MIVLQVTDPPSERRIVHFAGDKVTIGRGRDCDLELSHETVSKKHAEIVKTSEGFLLRDLESYNGTYLNDRWITETRIKGGDKIRVGRFTIVFLTPASEAEITAGRRSPLPPPKAAGEVPEVRSASSRITWIILASGLLALCAIQAAVLFYVLKSPPRSGGTNEKRKTKPTVATEKPTTKARASSERREKEVPAASIAKRTTEPKRPRAEKKTAPGPRPEFRIPDLGIAPEKELLLRRIFTDLRRRPPTDEELRRERSRTPGETVRSLLESKEFKVNWGGRPGRVLRELWNEPLPPDVRSATKLLVELYEKALPRSPRSPEVRVQAAALLVDLQGRVPRREELDLVEKVLSSPGPSGGVLPLIAFLLGRVPPPADPDIWITRSFVRFLARPPTAREKEKVLTLLKEKGGPRGVVLGLASSVAVPSSSRSEELRAVVLLHFAQDPTRWTRKPAEEVPNFRKFCREGMTILKVRLESVPRPPTAALPFLKALGAGWDEKSWFLVPSSDPYVKWAGKTRFFTFEGTPPQWKKLEDTLGKPEPLPDGELRAARKTREMCGTDLSELEEAETVLFVRERPPSDPNRLLLLSLEKVIREKPHAVAVVIDDSLRKNNLRKNNLGERNVEKRNGKKVESEDADSGDLKRLDTALGEVWKALSERQAEKKTVFVYAALPLSASRSKGETGRAFGTALLWGGTFKRGVVSTTPVNWSQLSATILSTLGLEGEKTDKETRPGSPTARPPEEASAGKSR